MGHSVIDDKDDDFEVSGPTHMRSNGAGAGAGSKIVIDWENAEHRRCVMACLVKGTYVMENDRLKCRNENGKNLAPAWWEGFGFTKMQSFINDTDPSDTFTYGAVFCLLRPYQRHPSAPEYVVAFRGTMLCHPKFMAELVQDFWVLFNALTDYTRFKNTYPEVDSYMSKSDSVWLAGHSLGASMALEIGRNQMLEKGRNVPTFLFNPPHVSAAPIIAEELMTPVYTVSFMFKFALANMMPDYHQRTKQLFQQLAPWVPELHINPDDTICKGFYDYFRERQIVAITHPRIAKTAARVSYRDMFVSMFKDKVQPHLLPSVRLWTTFVFNKEEAHNLRQWWQQDGDLRLTTKRFQYLPHTGVFL